MGKMGRIKGAAYERHIARLFRRIGFPDAKRHLEFQSDEAEEGRDLDGTQPFAIQCKCWKSTPSISAIDEVTPTKEYPIRMAILKRTMSKDKKFLEVVVIDLSVFLNLLNVLLDYSGLYKEYWQPCIRNRAEEILRKEKK